jgi:hypothetical protein
LGHLNTASLSNLLSRFHIPCTNKDLTPLACEECHKGKHVRLPFSDSNRITYFPFQLIHCDFWTSPTESVTRFKYYLIVIDDYSRYTWTYPLCFKSDATSILHDFYNYVLTQFHFSILCIQCDNGCEFDNTTLRTFLSSKRNHVSHVLSSYFSVKHILSLAIGLKPCTPQHTCLIAVLAVHSTLSHLMKACFYSNPTTHTYVPLVVFVSLTSMLRLLPSSPLDPLCVFLSSTLLNTKVTVTPQSLQVWWLLLLKAP